MPSKNGKPAAGIDRGGPSNVSRQGHSNSTRKRASNQRQLTFRIPPDGAPVTVTGREAQTLALLIQSGPNGFTSGEASPLGWARRTSHYIYRLRRLGLAIVTTWEDAGDAMIGRYTLTGKIEVVSRDRAPPYPEGRS